ncbi:MAG: hypothetical protein ABSB31_04230 [Dehalococcoidia bacterium]
MPFVTKIPLLESEWLDRYVVDLAEYGSQSGILLSWRVVKIINVVFLVACLIAVVSPLLVLVQWIGEVSFQVVLVLLVVVSVYLTSQII